jgi:hypothetical protein
MKPMNFVKLISVSICLLSFLFLTQGCLNDDLSVCGVRLSFNYTDTIGGDNKFASEVGKANVYIFDAVDSIFITEYAATFEELVDGHILPVNLAVGKYLFITWGNIGGQFEITPLVPNSSSFSDARLRLNVLDNTLREYPDSVYYGIDTVEVKATDLVLNKEIGLNLVKNNKRINVTTRWLYEGSATTGDASSYRCQITSKNGTYKFDNYPTGEQYIYRAPHEEADSVDFVLRSNFVVLREFNDNSRTDSKLKVFHNRGGTRQGEVEEEYFDVPLTRCLEPYAVADGRPIEDIPVFDIELIISETSAGFSVVVRPWKGDGSDVILY